MINALSEMHHPCQALADLLTIREQLGSLAGRRLVFVGDGNNNVTHSLLEACALAGMDITVSCPLGYEPRSEIVDGARRAAGRAADTSRSSMTRARPSPARDAVYTDVWVSMGEEGEQQRRRSDLASYQVNGGLMSLASRDAIFLHCLPAHRGQEVTADVIDGPQSVVWQQAANRLPTEQALLYALITGDWTQSADAGDDCERRRPGRRIRGNRRRSVCSRS